MVKSMKTVVLMSTSSSMCLVTVASVTMKRLDQYDMLLYEG